VILNLRAPCAPSQTLSSPVKINPFPEKGHLQLGILASTLWWQDSLCTTG
jgi:hypothetical protein